MTPTLFASFDQASTVVAAVYELKQAGISAHNLEVLSSQPHLNHQFLPERSETHIGAFAVTGALVGAVAGFALATLTALAYPLPTGGMPLLSWWPIGIVSYETTMLGAVLATLVGLLSELRLPHLKSLRPGVTVDEGLMIEIRCGSADEVAVAKEIVRRSGGKSIRQHQT
jgi:hypothetical protein